MTAEKQTNVKYEKLHVCIKQKKIDNYGELLALEPKHKNIEVFKFAII